MQKRSPKHHNSWGDMEQELNREKRVKFNIAKSLAKRNGHQWNFSFSDVDWPSHCPILGLPLAYFSEGRTDSSVSIRLIDMANSPSLLICSYRATKLLQFSDEELQAVLKYRHKTSNS